MATPLSELNCGRLLRDLNTTLHTEVGPVTADSGAVLDGAHTEGPTVNVWIERPKRGDTFTVKVRVWLPNDPDGVVIAALLARCQLRAESRRGVVRRAPFENGGFAITLPSRLDSSGSLPAYCLTLQSPIIARPAGAPALVVRAIREGDAR